MRPRTRKEQPSRLSNAVTRLRQALGQTQQQFAKTLGVGIATVARYETSRNPGGPALVRLRDFTRFLTGKVADNRPDMQHELFDLDDIFYSALVNEFPLYRGGLALTLMGHTSECRQILGGILESQSTPAELHPKLQEVINILEEAHRQVSLFDPMKVTLPEGATAENIAEQFVPMFVEGKAGRPVSAEESNAAVKLVKRGIAKVKRAERKAEKESAP